VRLRAIAASARAAPRGDGRWLAEHEAKTLLRARGVPVVGGRLASSEDDAVAAFHELACPVALKVSATEMRHKTQAGALVLDVRNETSVRDAFQRLAGVMKSRIPRLDNPTRGAAALNAAVIQAEAAAHAGVLVEAMAPPGIEAFVAMNTEAVVPALVIGLGGIHVEALDRVAIVPLPAEALRIERAVATLGLPRQVVDVAARIVAAADGLELLECNPVVIHADGAVVVDAIAKEVAT
jgi:acyl-CoA synthetase (NDP forming)